MSTPRGSLPMVLPGAPFALADAMACAVLVDVAYDQCQQWIKQDYPDKSKFSWKPQPTDVTYIYSAPLFWTYQWGEWSTTTYDEPIGFVARTAGGDAFLVFRGTVTDADWEQDGRVDQVAYALVGNHGYVHAGYYEIYRKLSPQILPILGGLGPISRFFFTGHSLGCGLSTLAVPDVLAHTAIRPTATLPVLHLNFASPRVGDPQFTAMTDRNGVPAFRIVNTEDLVPAVPPAVLGTILYKHIGTPVPFTAQYDTTDHNHSLDIAYGYALAHPDNPEGPLPERALGTVGSPVRR